MLTIILAFPFQYTNCFSLSGFSNYYFTNLYSIGLERKDSKHRKTFCHYLALNPRVIAWGENQNAGIRAPSSRCLSKFHQVKYNFIEFLELLLPIQESML